MKLGYLVLASLMVGCVGSIEGSQPIDRPEDLLAFEANCEQYLPEYNAEISPTEFPMNIVIASSAETHDIGLVLEAIDAWNQRVGAEVLYATVTHNLNMHGMCNFATLTTDAVPTDNNWIGLAVYGPCAGNMVFAADMIYVETMNTVGSFESSTFYTDLVVKQIAMHELGHVLGLGHEKDPKSIMFESIGDDVRIITERSKCLVIKALYESTL